MSIPKKDVEIVVEEDHESSLPQTDEFEAAVHRAARGGIPCCLARCHFTLRQARALETPAFDRMIDPRGDPLNVGKAKIMKTGCAGDARHRPVLPSALSALSRSTRVLESVVTRTDTVALPLEANLIKRLRPRFKRAPALLQVVSLTS